MSLLLPCMTSVQDLDRLSLEMCLPSRRDSCSLLAHLQQSVFVQEDKSNSYFGCTVGRVANRIRNAAFPAHPPSAESSTPSAATASGAPEATCTLEANDPPHALHGGSQHWGRQEWAAAASGERQVCSSKHM